VIAMATVPVMGARSSIPSPVGSSLIRRPLSPSYPEHEKRAVFAGKKRS